MKLLRLCVAAAVCLCLTSCTLTAPSTTASLQNAGDVPTTPVQTTEKGRPATSIQTNAATKPTPPDKDVDFPLLTMAENYPYFDEKDTFSKIKIDEFGDVFWWGYSNPHKIMLMKATIVEDYYNTIESGTQITMRLDLYDHEDDNGQPVFYDAQVWRDFLSKFDYFFFYSYIQNEYYHTLDYTEMFNEEMLYVNYVYFGLLPISDGKLDLNSLMNFYEENELSYFKRYSETEFWNYVQDGLDESVFAEYIRENKEREVNLE